MAMITPYSNGHSKFELKNSVQAKATIKTKNIT